MFINDCFIRRRTCRKFPLLEQYFFYLIGIILLKPYFVEVVSIYDAVNNYRFKHIFPIISSIFPRNHWSCLNMLNKIVFVKGKLNAIEYQKMVHGELLLFAIEIKDHFSPFIQLPLQDVLLRFRNRIITMASIESWTIDPNSIENL